MMFILLIFLIGFKLHTFMNDFCLKPSPMDNTLPHLFHINLKTIAHNKIVYDY